MKPGIKAVFPCLKDEQLKEIYVEKIRISKHLKKMQIVISEEIGEELSSVYERKLGEHYKMHSVKIYTEDNVQEFEDDEFDYKIDYNKKPEQNKYIPKDLGKAHSGGVIFGGTIRSTLVPIMSISEMSKDVCFEGYVFGMEDKDITARKTGKTYKKFILDITDLESSISVHIFMEANEDNLEKITSIQKAFGKVNKSVSKSKSLTLFMNKFNIKDAIRITEDNFSIKKGVRYIPIYAVFCLADTI